jgi:hypothetical protein
MAQPKLFLQTRTQKHRKKYVSKAPSCLARSVTCLIPVVISSVCVGGVRICCTIAKTPNTLTYYYVFAPLLQRLPITTQERAALEAQRAAAAASSAHGSCNGTSSSTHTAEDGALVTQQAAAAADTGDFFKVFDAWVDTQWKDRAAATKVKVGFRKEHKKLLNTLNLEEIEEIAECL